MTDSSDKPSVWSVDEIKSLQDENERLKQECKDLTEGLTISYVKGAESTKAENEILKSRASQFESTMIETMRVRDQLQTQLAIALEALKYYATHESVIKEAYHSNDEKQITVVHTFLNHKALEALEQIGGEK